MAAYRKIAAHSGYFMLSNYKVPNCQFCFPTSVFGVFSFFLIAPFPDHCLLLPFSYQINCKIRNYWGLIMCSL